MTVAEKDPLALAKWVYRQYVDHPGQKQPPQKTLVLEATSKVKDAQKHQFARSGESWSENEKIALAVGVIQGKSFGVLAVKHQRTPASLKAQVAKMGQQLSAAARG